MFNRRGDFGRSFLIFLIMARSTDTNITPSTRGRGGNQDGSGRSDNAAQRAFEQYTDPYNNTSQLTGDIDNFIDIPYLMQGAFKPENPYMKLLSYMKQLAGVDHDAQIAIAQILYQHLQSEENYQRDLRASERQYERSLASNQVAQMMAAGMSRAAALAALNGGSGQYSLPTSDGTITPQATQIAQNRAAMFDNILSAVQMPTQLANQMLSLASIPLDQNAKRITNDILTNQDQLLNAQVEGMNDAAMFLQAVANHDAVSDNKLSALSFADQYKHFQKMRNLLPTDDGYVESDALYSRSDSYERSTANPYFWATLNSTRKDTNLADASNVALESALASVAQLRAQTEYVSSLAEIDSLRSRILSVDAFVSEYTQQARADMELMKAECDKNNFAFDNERAKSFISRVQDFTTADFLELDYRIKNLQLINNPEVWQKERARIIASEDYQIANYIYGTAVTSLNNGTLQQLQQDDPELLSKWSQNYLRFAQFGMNDRVQAATDIARTVFTGVGSLAVAAGVGYKIWTGLGSAAKASATAASSVGSSLPSLPFNVAAPAVITTIGADLFKQRLGGDIDQIIY